MDNNENESKKKLITRLRRIEGQIKGIEKMIDNESCCKDILVQVAAVRAAVNKVGALVLENYAESCLRPENEEVNDKFNELVSSITMFIK